MSNYNPRTFNSFGLLRSIPAALLHRFFTPYRAYLVSQKFEWPADPESLDHKVLHETLLKPDGKLLTCIFPIGAKAGGPPYALSVELLKSLLLPFGLAPVEIREDLPDDEQHRPGGALATSSPSALWVTSPVAVITMRLFAVVA